jgi:hypothetical protein
LTLVLFALSRTLWLSIALMLPLGAATMVQMTATNTLVQTLTPDALRGRVMAIGLMIFMGFAPRRVGHRRRVGDGLRPPASRCRRRRRVCPRGVGVSAPSAALVPIFTAFP